MAALMEQLRIMGDLQTQADIIQACKQGDREAFHLLYEEHKDRVYTIAFHYSGDESMARDVTQQVFLKLFTSIAQFREDSEFTTWLYRIVANACTDEHRKQRRFLPVSPPIAGKEMTAERSPEEAYCRQPMG